jgi:hypothetical protein
MPIQKDKRTDVYKEFPGDEALQQIHLPRALHWDSDEPWLTNHQCRILPFAELRLVLPIEARMRHFRFQRARVQKKPSATVYPP